MRHRMGFLVIVGLVASLVSTTSGQGANDPAGADVAAHDFLQKATAEITRLENDITALEAAWTKQFVGRLGRESAPIPADDLLDPLRSAQREVDRLRRGLHGQGVAAGGAQLDRYAEVAAQTTFERWRLTLAETALSVELAGQEYERAATEARRMGARPEQREAAVRREREARTLAGRSLAVAREGLRRARETVFATLGSLEEALRRAGRASAAGALESRIDTELNVTAAGDTAVRTALDRFLSAQTIVIEDPVGEERPQPLTLSGALTPLDLAATPAPAAALDVVRLAPAGEYERAPELGFERGHRIELTFDREPGVGRHEAVVQWREGLEARTLTIPIASDNGRSHYSDPFEIWPSGSFRLAPRQVTAAEAGRPRGMSVLGGDTAAPTAAAGQAAAGPDWTALVTPIDAEITRITADLQLTPAPLSERDVRARMRALRVSLAELAQSPSTETPPADSRAYREIGAFRTTWEALAEAVWSGRPPSQPLEADQWTAVAATFKDAACRNLAPPVRLAGRAWVCMTNEFFKELVRLEGLAEGVTASLREREIAPLRQSVVDAERALATGTAPGATRVSVSRARLDATVRILQTELKVAELRRLDLQRRRALSSDSSSPYGWFLEWSAKTPSRPLWRRAPYVLRADPGSVVRVTFAGATIERTVERGLPDDLPAFFARAVHDAHDQARRLSFDASHRIDIQLVEYEASLERRFPAARTSSGGAASWQQAIEARRQELQRNSIDDIAAPRARLDRARQLAFEAIEGAR